MTLRLEKIKELLRRLLPLVLALLAEIAGIADVFWYLNTTYEKIGYTRSVIGLDSFQRLFLFFSIILIVLTILAFYFLFFKGWRTARIFPLLWLPFLCFFLLLIPPAEGYDENAHFATATITADKLLGRGDENTRYVSRAEIDTGLVTEAPNHEYYAWYLDSLFLKDPAAAELVEIKETSVMGGEYPDYLYFFYACGLLLGRKLMLSGVGIFMLSRLFGLLPLIILGFYTMRALPIGKEILLVLLCLPASLQAVVTINPDGEMLLLSAALVAALLRQLTRGKSEVRSWRDWLDYALIIFSTVTLCQCKYGASVPCALLPLLLLLRRGERRRSVRIGAVLTSIGAFLIGFLPLLFTTFQRKGATTWAENYTLGDILSDPLSAGQVFLNTVNYEGYNWFRQGIGSMLGNMNILVSDLFAVLLFVLLLAAAIPKRSEVDFYRGGGYAKILLGAVSLLSIACCIGGMMIGATVKDYPLINGVQGRYFLPFLLPLFLALQPRTVTIAEESTFRQKIAFGLLLTLGGVVLSLFRWS